MSYSSMDIGGSGKFLKIGSGETVQFRILSKEPFKKMIHRGDKSSTPCIGSGCANCQDGDMPKTRWLINVFNRKTKKVNILEFGPVIAKQIKNIAKMLEDEGNTIFQVDLRINATGEGLNKTYTVLTKDTSDQVPEDLKLYDLATCK